MGHILSLRWSWLGEKLVLVYFLQYFLQYFLRYFLRH
jgi:hypothetical protein